MGCVRLIFAGLFVLAPCIGACIQTDFGDDRYADPERAGRPDGPGNALWGSSDISCGSDDDCVETEECIENICQMRRCKGAYPVSEPLASRHYFRHDRELVSAGGGSSLSAYSVTTGNSLAATGSGSANWRTGSTIRDVAGGSFTGERPERPIVAVHGSRTLQVLGGAGERVKLDFTPHAIATGDFDRDGRDEVVAISSGRDFALCHVDTGECEGQKLRPGARGVDVAAADVDGDHIAEAVILSSAGGRNEITTWNRDMLIGGVSDEDGEPPAQDEGSAEDDDSAKEFYTHRTEETSLIAVAAGDVNGDSIAEAFLLRDGSVADLVDNPLYQKWSKLDSIQVWRVGTAAQMVSEIDVESESADLIASDFNMDDTDEVALLYGGNRVRIYTGLGGGSPERPVSLSGTRGGLVSSGTRRIAALDIDGDSPMAERLPTGNLDDPWRPELVPGEITPLIQIHYPPYVKEHSGGGPYVYVGRTEGHGRFRADVVSLYTGVEVGFSGGDKVGIDVSTRLRTEVRHYRRRANEQYIGDRAVAIPNPRVHGGSYSEVVIGSACYQVYRYALDDPSGNMGGDTEFTLAVPVDGQVTTWSSTRYNALARATGDLPVVGPSYQIGSLDSYPNTPQRPDGTPIAEEDLVFKNTPTFPASDSARAGWFFSAREYEVKEQMRYSDVNGRAGVKVFGVKFSAERGAGAGSGWGVYIGKEVLFGGAVPPLEDNPNTPEDEHALNLFRFTPYVHREHFSDEDGAGGFYYVLTYTVDR